MSERVRNCHFSELCFPVTFSRGSRCAFHCTEEEGEQLDLRDGKESFAFPGKLGVLEVRHGNHITG